MIMIQSLRSISDISAEEIIKRKKMRYLMATVHPDNIYSLRNMEKLGMKAVLETKKYGGKQRYIMCKTLEYQKKAKEFMKSVM